MAKPKEIPGLDCGAAEAEAIGLVLLARFDEMCQYRAAALEGADIEGVHDMRVASRRLRSALRDFAPRLRRGKRLDAARASLKALADALGAVRDEDVLIHALEKIKADAPSEAVAGIEEYVSERRERREEARAGLAGAIDEESVAEARRLLARALEGRGKPRGAKKDGRPAAEDADFGGALREVVRRLWGELAELSPCLYRPYKTRRLHEMRIAAKRLRYALELLICCRRDGATKELARDVADLQGALGDLHDCDMWGEDLGRQLSDREAGSRAGLSDERTSAVVWLLGHFVEKRVEHYREALTLWQEWERAGFKARLDACLDAAGETPE